MNTIIRGALQGGCYRSTRPALVDPGASWAVFFRPKSLWTVPELWKTHKPRFPRARWTAPRTRRSQRSTRPIVFMNEDHRRKRTDDARSRNPARYEGHLMNMVIRGALQGGCYRSTRPAIVDPGASWAVFFRPKSLWTVPELWKTHKPRFPRARWTANAPPTTVHKADCFHERRPKT